AVFSGTLADPEIELTQHATIGAVEQDLVPEYPLGEVDLAVNAERGSDGTIHIASVRIANGKGGTTLGVSGTLALGAGSRTMSVTTRVTQDLERLSTIPDRFKGRGRLDVEAKVASPDLQLYQVRASVKGEDVNVALPRAAVEVESANGEVPIAVTLRVGANGVALARNENKSPYSMLRFADQHPLLNRSGFLSVGRIKTPLVSIAPLVGNLEVEENTFSLRQFELGLRGGKVTGQCGLDWDGPRSTLELHV